MAAFFEGQGWPYEIILVNDGSRDNSWEVVKAKAAENPNVVAINMLRNYGQHTAVYCGLENATGDWAITLDDDLQNPPEEIVHLVAKAAEGHDVVYGKFKSKKHSSVRRLGSRLIGMVNTHIFKCPADITLTNYRLMHRDVVKRIVGYRTSQPYITGLSIMFAANPANALVEHREREVGTSQYTFFRIARLVMRILFNYSAWPLRMVNTIGMIVAAFSFVLGLYFIIKRLLGNVQVSGWTSLIVLLSFFNGISMVILGMLGEYIVRLLNESTSSQIYHVREKITTND